VIVAVADPAVTIGFANVEDVLFPPPSEPDPEALLPLLEEVSPPLIRFALLTFAVERLLCTLSAGLFRCSPPLLVRLPLLALP
jgi:hypothetical protein